MVHHIEEELSGDLETATHQLELLERYQDEVLVQVERLVLLEVDLRSEQAQAVEFLELLARVQAVELRP